MKCWRYCCARICCWHHTAMH